MAAMPPAFVKIVFEVRLISAKDPGMSSIVLDQHQQQYC
jgi:hypothetical protein